MIHRRALSLAAGLLCVAAPAGQAVAAEGVTRERSGETGELTMLGTAPGAALPAPQGLDPDEGPRASARAFVDEYGPRFGIADGAADVVVDSVERSPGLGRTVALEQRIDGLPVIGGGLLVNFDPSGEVTSISGEAVPESPATTELDVGAGEASRSAVEAVAKAHRIDAGSLVATEPELAVFDSRILGGPGLEVPTLVWELEVSAGGDVPSIRELVIVDALAGVVVVSVPLIHPALDRRICDAGNTVSRVPCLAPFTRSEGDPPAGISDADDAYSFSGDTYIFFAGLGRDGIDGAGGDIVSTTRFCQEATVENCPFDNAFWNGSQMVYGEGWAADDIVAHEYTHGVTGFESGLFYYYQSGAINESLSDVFGELVDLGNGAGTDTPATRWLIGEDIAGIGTLRDMEDPPAFGDPDRMGSPNYVANPHTGPRTGDAGGVHTNSGVNNKAAYLLTDGGTFNGRTVSSIGAPADVAMLYHRVNDSLLGSAADYGDLAAALRQACTDLTGSGGITGADCAQVDSALLATEMDAEPPVAAAPRLGACDDPVDVHETIYAEDFENAGQVAANWAPRALAGANSWTYPGSAAGQKYATSGSGAVWGYDQPVTSDSAWEMTRDFTVPVQGRLRFNHAYGFESDINGNWDGGVLEYSRDGGGTWVDAGGLITDGGYVAEISSGPLSGRVGWVRDSGGYETVRADLSSLAGESVRFRFRIASDTTRDDYGQFIDDFELYACRNPNPPDTRITKAPRKVRVKAGARRAKVRVKFVATDDATPLREMGFECRVGTAAFKPCLSPADLKLKPKGRKQKIAVRSTDDSGNVDPSPDVAKVKVVRKRRGR